MRLIDADALVVDLEKRYTYEMADGRNKAYGKGVRDAIKDIWDAPTVGGWISVEDRLPEDERFVLVCNDDGKMMVAQYIAEMDKWQYRYMAYDVDVWDDTEQGPVEWWMPLPEAPGDNVG